MSERSSDKKDTYLRKIVLVNEDKLNKVDIGGESFILPVKEVVKIILRSCLMKLIMKVFDAFREVKMKMN
jgi:hypothetical protein